MKRFRFGLAAVQTIRAHGEVRARERFAEAVRVYVAREEDLVRIRARITEFASMIFESRARGFSASDNSHCLAGFRRESAAEIPAERAVFEARAEMEQRRAEYIEARRRVKQIGRLEEARRAAHKAEFLREEQAEFDDMSGHRIARDRMSNI